MKKIRWILAVFIVAVLIISLFVIVFEAYGMKVVTKDEYDAFIKKTKAIGYSDLEIAEIFGDERVVLLMPRVSEKIYAPGYFSPDSNLFKPESIRRGREILREKKEILREAERTFGIKKEILVAIFRLETNFGRFVGKNLVFNSLYRVFVFKERKWGEDELLKFLLICKTNGYDPLTVVGSSMGAFGLWQFLPSSFIRHARDWDGDGKIDLFSFHDALFSAANYLQCYGSNKKSSVRIETALHAYNHDWLYVKAILAYAETLMTGFDDARLKDLKKFKRFIERKYLFW